MTGEDALALNPLAEIVLHRRGGDVIAASVAAPRPGHPLRIVTFSREEDPGIVDLLHRIAAGDDLEAELDDAEWARLAEVGLLVPGDRIPARPLFRCDPRDLAARGAPPRDRLRAHPALRYDGAIGAPDEARAPRSTFGPGIAQGDVNPFASDCSWVWVDHPDAAVPGAISITASDRNAIDRLRPGEAPSDDLDPELARSLFQVDVLVDPADVARRREAWATARAAAAAELRRDRYAVLRGLIHPVQIASLGRYYRQLVAEGHVRFDDRQVPLRFSAHDEPLARFFHRRLAALVGELAGEPVKPSYAFFASYRPGAVLEPHRDREQCAISISLLVDYEPDPGGVSPWPLFLGLDGRAVAIHLGPGDGLVYRGAELVHWRDALPEGHASTSIFLHYVPLDFDGPLD